MADLELDPGEAFLLHGARRPGQQVLQRKRQPADIGIIRLETIGSCATEQAPERHACLLRLEIPERDVDGGQRQMGDPRTADPLQGRIACEFGPKTLMFVGILADQQRRVAIPYTGRDQPVGGDMGMGAGKAVALQPVGGFDHGADDTPMGDAVGAVGNRVRGQRQMQDEWLYGFDLHSWAPPPGGRHQSVLTSRCRSR